MWNTLSLFKLLEFNFLAELQQGGIYKVGGIEQKVEFLLLRKNMNLQ
jgi:preprotein translocase subunit SecB